MDILATVSGLLYLAISLNVGVRLVRNSLVRRNVAQALVGTSQLVSMFAAMTLAIGMSLSGPRGEIVTALAFLVLVGVGVLPFLLLWKIFRPRAHAMSWIVVGAIFVLGGAYLVDLAGPGFSMAVHRLVPPGIFPWIFVTLGIVSSIWHGIEALQLSMLPRHGLDPFRSRSPACFALWTVGSGALAVLYLLILAQYLGALPQAVTYLIVPLCTGVHATCLQLIFFPPKALHSWVRA